MAEACKDAQSRTAESEHAYQVKVNSLSKQLASIKRVRRGYVTVDVGSAAGRLNGKGTAGVEVNDVRLPIDVLLDRADSDERTRLRLNGLQDFVCEEYAKHGINLQTCVR